MEITTEPYPSSAVLQSKTGNKRLHKLFPLYTERNVAMYYILECMYSIWFVGGVWVFIWGRFMSKTQMGISDAITFTVGFIFELPSGVIADLMGRRRAILFGNVLLVIGNLLLGISDSFFSFTLWYLVWTVGYAFQSGATEALAYDTVKKLGRENEWPSIIATSTVIGRTTSLLATALGGFLFGIWFRLPYLVMGFIGVIGVIAAYRLKEIPIAVKPSGWSFKDYLRQIKDGVGTLAKPLVLPVTIASIAVASVAYLYNWGLLRPLTGERFGYSPVNFPILLSVISLVVIMATVAIVKIHIKVEILLFLSALVFSAMFFYMGFPHQWIMGGLIMMILSIASMYVDQSFSKFINLHTLPEHRATTLSAVALFTRAPYVVLAVLIGTLAEKNSLPQFTLIVGGVILIIVATTGVLYRKHLLT